jgi:hypothetical protein
MGLEGVPDFGLKPYKLWVWNDVIACATYPAPHGSGLNGYVQLPEDFPDLPAIADYVEAKRIEHERAPGILAGMRYSPSGYDFINDYVEVHGGLTYGPDEDRWIGFDTNHAWDDWSDAELERMFKVEHPEAWANLNHYWEVLGHDSWPPGRIGGKYKSNDPWAISWTEALMDTEVNSLAEQIYKHHKGGNALVAHFLKKASSDAGS